ncbi:hypothetical protein L204_101306 [Cryptococcus depauperatus]
MAGPLKTDLDKKRVERQKGQDKESGRFSSIQLYLILYNTLSALLWGHLLILTLWFMVTPRVVAIDQRSFVSKLIPRFLQHSHSQYLARAIHHLEGSYDFHGLGWWTKWTQTLAVLEVVHAGLGWVRSPVGTVTAQVASRIWTVWGVIEAVPHITHRSPLFTTMLLAWSLTEVIRYTFYTLSLLSVSSPALNYLRYTTFIPLYPLGAGSEAFLSFSTLPPISPLVGKAVGKAIGALPRNVREFIIKSKAGREILWWVAKGSMSLNQWGVLEAMRAGLFIIWWPGRFILRRDETDAPSIVYPLYPYVEAEKKVYLEEPRQDCERVRQGAVDRLPASARDKL